MGSGLFLESWEVFMRNLNFSGFVLLAIVLCLTLSVGGAEETKKYTRVYSPYYKIELTDKQKQQIATIQGTIRDKIKALEAEEERQVYKLLTEKQIAQLDAMDEEARIKRAEYSKQYRERKKAEEAAAKAKK
jgi:hypothetical protein